MSIKVADSQDNQANITDSSVTLNTDSLQQRSLIEDMPLPEDVASFIVDADNAEESDLITEQEYDSVLAGLNIDESFKHEQREITSKKIGWFHFFFNS